MTNAFHKRLKRHVIGRHREYFAVTSPGLEALCRRELMTICPDYAKPEIEDGGVRFNGRLDDCMLANLKLRTANRILMRVAEFRASGFARLQNQTARIQWELFLRPGANLKIRVATHHCRLYHTTAVAERIAEGIQARLGAVPSHETADQQLLFVRGVDDRFTVSLDSSGALLYRRGLKSHRARAPIRETTAAAALMLARFSPAQTMLDPMCGSGTFALEAAMQIAGIPAGWFRRFAFFNWPAFTPERWAHLKKQSAPAPQVEAGHRIIAADIDPEACRVLKRCVDRFDLAGVVDVVNGDFFDHALVSAGSVPGLLILNPPYGRRLGSKRQSDHMLGRIASKLQSDYKNWKFVLVVPRSSLLSGLPFKFKVHPITHGGLHIKLTYGRI